MFVGLSDVLFLKCRCVGDLLDLQYFSCSFMFICVDSGSIVCILEVLCWVYVLISSPSQWVVFSFSYWYFFDEYLFIYLFMEHHRKKTKNTYKGKKTTYEKYISGFVKMILNWSWWSKKFYRNVQLNSKNNTDGALRAKSKNSPWKLRELQLFACECTVGALWCCQMLCGSQTS